ncbi:MAG: peptide ABC transporter substrate-binding protein [Caldilineaceae bacterium]
MQQIPSYTDGPLTEPGEGPSPADSLARHFPWLLGVALIGIVLLLALLAYSTYTVATVLVPDRGGTFREGVAGSPQYLSPIWCQGDDVDRDLCTLIYRGLTRIDKSGRVVPDLAASWTVDNDTTYTFKLKPDQFWQDGRTVTADDVLFTVGVLQDPSLVDTPGLPSFWRNVKVEKVDDLTVRFTLPQPLAPFLDYTTIGLLPKHRYENVPPRDLVTRSLAPDPVGAGPMRVTEYAADHLKLEPSTFYGGSSPYISTLEFEFFPDYASVLAAFEAGQIDGIRRILPSDIKTAAGRDDLQVFSSVESGYVNVLLNVANPNVPFLQDKSVRQALMFALDRDTIVRDVLAGQGVVADSLLTPENWAFNPAVKRYPYDPGQANRLLDAAGWVDTNGDGIREKDGQPLRFVLLVRDDNLHKAIGAKLGASWKAIGVDAQVTPVSFAGMVSDFLVPRTFEVALTNWDQVGDPDPYAQWHSSQATGNGQNYAGWSNADADALMEQARRTTDPEQRKALYQKFQDIFAEELPALPLYYPVYTYGVSSRVNNVQIGSINDPSERFRSFADWYIDSRRVPANQVPAGAPPTPPGAPPAAGGD